MQELPTLTAVTHDGDTLPTTIEAPIRSYHVYHLQDEDSKCSIGVPTDRVEEFDAFFSENPEALGNIIEHLEDYDAVVIE